MGSNVAWRELREEIVGDDKDRDAEIRRGAKAILLQSKLTALRESRGTSQRKLAEHLEVSQANISRIEHEDDIRVSTLLKYVEGLGGSVKIDAVFDGEHIELV